jgi:hypothetical protein
LPDLLGVFVSAAAPPTLRLHQVDHVLTVGPLSRGDRLAGTHLVAEIDESGTDTANTSGSKLRAHRYTSRLRTAAEVGSCKILLDLLVRCAAPQPAA